MPVADGLRSAFSSDSSSGPSPGKDGDANTMPRKAEGGTHRRVTVGSEKATGTATVVNSSYASDDSADYVSMTNRFINEQRRDPDASSGDLWSRAVQNDRNPGGFVSDYAPQPTPAPSSSSSSSFPAFAAIQQDHTRVDPRYSGAMVVPRQQALVISNGDYAVQGTDLDLKWAHADGAAMEGYFKSEGYAVERHKDLKGADLSSSLKAYQKGFLAGDSVAVYYVGHGDQSGLIGSDGKTTPYGDLSGIVSGALGGGYHAQVITDCCNSGAMVYPTDVAVESAFGPLSRSFQKLTIDTEAATQDDLYMYDHDGQINGKIGDKDGRRSLYTSKF